MKINKIEKLFHKIISSNTIFESTLFIENSSGDSIYSQEYGRYLNTPMLMASITKLFTTACILSLLQQGKLSLEDKISRYLEKETIEGLHVYKGKDCSFDLTITQLLFQTSGLPDYYMSGSDSISKQVIREDFAYSFDDELKRVKAMKPRFLPGKKGRAYYADVNFDLLGKIIEKVNKSTLQEAYEKYIFVPLNLKNTYLASNENDFVPHTYYKDKRLERPKLIRSCYSSGGGVTNAKELMIFIKAFWGGQLFDKEIFDKLSHGNRMQLSYYPIRYAGGYMKIKAGLPFGKKITLIGHSGSTGSFAFYCPEKDMFFVGDVPQIANPSLCIRLVMRAAFVIN